MVKRNPMIAALTQRYPQFTLAEIKRLADLINQAIAEAVATGKHITFIEVDGVGTVNFETLFVHERPKP